MDKMDKEELIRVIMRFRGKDNKLLRETNALIVSDNREICSIWNLEVFGKKFFLVCEVIL
jgi:hypothetical protein